MFNDLGVYGVPRAVRERKRFDAVSAMRKMEEYTRSVGGYHFLYADTFLTRHVEKCNTGHLPPVLRILIRIHRIHMFLGLPDPDPSIIMQKF
jgi:hypothetical protein